jgi:RNA-binding protein YhbY
MPHPTLAKFQIGKNGLTEGVLESLQMALKHHKQVRISVLKSACRDRKELTKMAEELASKLPVKNHRIIGYTIILIK